MHNELYLVITIYLEIIYFKHITFGGDYTVQYATSTQWALILVPAIHVRILIFYTLTTKVEQQWISNSGFDEKANPTALFAVLASENNTCSGPDELALSPD